MILVTGGEGFIGSHVCSVLSAYGREVVAIDRTKPQEPDISKPYPSLVCDISDREQVEKIFQQYSITTIVHLASLLNTASRQYPAQATKINILGSLNALETACKFNVNKFIYGSSISVYGSKSPQIKNGVSETEPATPEDIYGVSKRYVEILGDVYQKQHGIQFISLRIATVIGPGAVKTASRWRSEIIEKLGLPYPSETTIPYMKTEKIPFVLVEDVAKMVKSLIDAEHTKFSIYNTPAETWALNDLAEYISSIDENLKIRFGKSLVTGIPKVVSAQRFMEEFNFSALSLKERLKNVSSFGAKET